MSILGGFNMNDYESFIGQLYHSLKVNGIIPKYENVEINEKKFYNAIYKLTDENRLTEDESSDLGSLFSNAAFSNEIRGFLAGLYLAGEIKKEMKF